MLNALKRIEARQTPGNEPKAAPLPGWTGCEPVATPGASPTAAETGEPIEPTPVPPADSFPSMLPEDPATSAQVSLDELMDQLQAFVAEAGSLYDTEPAADQAELPNQELPVIQPLNSDPYAATAQQILQRLPQGRSQVLLFTSPADGAGKTITLARLAPWLAEGMEDNVLVVDANFRNPDMAHWLSVAPAWRLPDVLANLADWAAAVRTTAQHGVSLLPGGSDALGRGLGSNIQGMSHLLRDLAGHYGLVAVDSASLAHRGTAQLAAFCDATYLVVRLGEGSSRLLREAVQVIHRNGGRLAGCVAVS